MTAASNYAETQIVNHMLRNTAWTSPTTVYVALFTTNPTDANSGTEVTGGSYARQSATFSAPTDGVTSNSSAVTFTSMPTATVTHFGLYDAVTSGNLLVHGALTASVAFTSGNNGVFNAGALQVTVA